MASIVLNLDTKAVTVAAKAIKEQVGRLAKLLDGLPLDHAVRLFELPVGDLWNALADSDMLVVAEKRDGDVALVPHPALVNLAGLIAAICDGIEAKLARERGAG